MNPILPLRLAVAPVVTDPHPLVIYHGCGCPDGFTAALAAWVYYGEGAEYLGLDHGEVQGLADLPDVSGRAVYILDFSFAPDILADIDAHAAKLVLLDHHKSAAQKLGSFKCRCGVVHFDMKKSGARLAWEFFLPDRPLPDLVRFVEDRDIWVWQFPQSAGFLAALDMEAFDFQRWSQIATFDAAQMNAYVERGKIMDEKFSQLAKGIVESARPLIFNGRRGLMVNAPGAFHSVVGDTLSKRSGSFALMWSEHQSGRIKVGLRSQPGFDVIPLAESMGGGGHACASGFWLESNRLLELLSGFFDANETPAAIPKD